MALASTSTYNLLTFKAATWNPALEIIEFSAIVMFTTISFGIKLNMTGYKDWSESIDSRLFENVNHAPFLKSVLNTRVHNWQHNVFGPLTKEMMTSCNCTYVLQVIRENRRDNSSNVYDPFVLHIKLVTKASELLVSCLSIDGEGLGEKTLLQIQKWFVTIQTEQMKMIWLHTADKYQDALIRVITRYDTIHEEDTTSTGEEYPFFDHNSLLIFLAQVVFMFCFHPIYSGEVMCADKNDDDTASVEYEHCENKRELWQNVSGHFFSYKWQMNEFKGLTNTVSISDFPLIEVLPGMLSTKREDFYGNTKLLDGAPCVHQSHSQLLIFYYDIISTLASGDESHNAISQWSIFCRFSEQAVSRNKSEVTKMSKPETVKLMYVNSMPLEKSYTPQYYFGQFDNDIFLMGHHSYNYIFSNMKKKFNSITRRTNG